MGGSSDKTGREAVASYLFFTENCLRIQNESGLVKLCLPSSFSPVTTLPVTVLLPTHGELPEGQPVSALTARAEPQVLWESEPRLLFPILHQWRWGSLSRAGKDLRDSESSDQPLPGARVPQRLQEPPAGSKSGGHPSPCPRTRSARLAPPRCPACPPAFLPACAGSSQDRKVGEKPLWRPVRLHFWTAPSLPQSREVLSLVNIKYICG